MLHIVSIFRFIVLPFHFLWISSVFSIEKMTKGYGRIIKSISSASSNLAEQKIVLRKTTHENKKTTGNDDIRQSSQKVIQKFRKLTTKFTSSKQEEPKTNNTLNTLSKDILVTQPSISTSNEEPKLKVCLMK